MMNKSFWNGKKVMITGHTGFKGSWLACILHTMGCSVYGYSLQNKTYKDNYVLAGISKFIDEVYGDIRSQNDLNQAFERFKPDIVFHLAAQPLVRLSYEKPKDTYEINVMGTLNVLEAIRKSNKTKAAVMVTSDKCYENKEQIWSYREDDRMGGHDPYSSSKGCAELLIASYHNSFLKNEGKFVASARAGNVIGGGDWSENRIIPDCVRALEDDEPIMIRYPNAVRPWQHVIEPLVGYIMLAEKLYDEEFRYCGGWNFGPFRDSVVPVKKVVELIIQEWGTGKWIDGSEKKSNLHEAGLLSLDSTKAWEYLHWKPVLNIKEAITYTIEWYRNYKKRDVYDICIRQIILYFKQREEGLCMKI